MELTVRAARPSDAAAGLLYESARPYYDAYAGDGTRARALLEAVYPRRGHAASFEVCLLAEADGAAARAGLRGVALDTGVANAPARALYEACGFRQRDERRVRDDAMA